MHEAVPPNSRVDEGMAARLGPMLPGETGFPARIRAHQAWYRSEVLSLPAYGRLPAPSGRPLGSVLDECAARAGKNFTDKQAHELYLWRRKQGWGVEPHRCTAVMTSSQALAINVFSLLRPGSPWATKSLASVLDMPLRNVSSVNVEVGQRGLLGHATLIDAVTVVETQAGQTLMLGWEVKLSDRYVSRELALGNRYADLVGDSRTWRPDALRAVARATNALFRCHALLEALCMATPGVRPGPFVLLRHDSDPRAAAVISRYRPLLSTPSNLIDCSLGSLLLAMKREAVDELQLGAVRRLEERYVDLSLSDAAWRGLRETGS